MALHGARGLWSGTSCAPTTTRRTGHLTAPTRPLRPHGAAEVNSIATRHRTGLTVAVALATVIVIAGLVVGSPTLEQVIPRLPDVPGTIVALGLTAVAVVTGAIVLVTRGAAAARARARRSALESVYSGAVSCGIRNRDLTARLGELRDPRSKPVALSSRFAIVADAAGISFWVGGRRPKRAAMFEWSEVRNIRSDSTVVGSASVPVAVLRIRRAGTSMELPIVLSDSRAGRYALVDGPFFAVVRGWKAKHRAALAAEGLELPPLTAPIPIIRQEQPAA